MSKDITVAIEGSNANLHLKRIKGTTDVDITITSRNGDREYAQFPIDADLLIPLAEALVRAHKLLSLL